MYHSVTLTGPADHAIPYHSLAPSQPVLSETLYSETETVLTFQLVVMPPVLGWFAVSLVFTDCWVNDGSPGLSRCRELYKSHCWYLDQHQSKLLQWSWVCTPQRACDLSATSLRLFVPTFIFTLVWNFPLPALIMWAYAEAYSSVLYSCVKHVRCPYAVEKLIDWVDDSLTLVVGPLLTVSDANVSREFIKCIVAASLVCCLEDWQKKF